MGFRVFHLHYQIYHDSVTLVLASISCFLMFSSSQPAPPHQPTVSPALHSLVGRTDSCLSVAWDGHDCLQSLRRSQAEHRRTEAQRGFFFRLMMPLLAECLHFLARENFIVIFEWRQVHFSPALECGCRGSSRPQPQPVLSCFPTGDLFLLSSFSSSYSAGGTLPDMHA